MKSIKFIATLAITMFFLFQLNAQSAKERRWQAAIDALEKSDFILKYDEFRSKAETDVAEFKLKSSTLQASETAYIKKNYEAALARFDNLLDDLKRDFTEPDNRRSIATQPDHYSRFLEKDLNEAIHYYNTECLAKMETAVQMNRPIAFGLMEAGMIIALGKELLQLWQSHSEKLNRQSGEYFERVFVNQHRLRRWEEL